MAFRENGHKRVESALGGFFIRVVTGVRIEHSWVQALVVFCRIKKALNRHVERAFNPDAKEHHWGKRKLKRDQ